MSASTYSRPPLHSLYPPPPLSHSFSRQIHFSHCQPPRLRSALSTGLKSHNRRFPHVFSGAKARVSAWEEKPYETLSSGKRSYLDVQDVVAFLDPPKELIPLDPASYNPAAYLWKKIEDIPEERRHQLLHLLKPRLISRAWEIAGTRYDDPKLSKKSASNLLSSKDDQMLLEFYNCRTSGVLSDADQCFPSLFWADLPLFAADQCLSGPIQYSPAETSADLCFSGLIQCSSAKTSANLVFFSLQHRQSGVSGLLWHKPKPI
ncbi:hypothetical protein JRO89_XS09G0063900 [Xanthoceras sorbifolium]|uniref:Uncharacterized protein n=1 Tax=Xanthoceras sorbifolium TaxID=99658 RepID=A0ABQ8HKX5_9ROSI|nr:hypothetical protein JRO89_XS09G0063900 [Xanthoceras sorbifolium]